MDFAERIQRGLPALRARVERPITLIDMVRAVGATIEPREIAEVLVDRVAGWLPVSWMLMSTNRTGAATVLAEHRPDPAAEGSAIAVARWVLEKNEVLASADLRHESRVASGGAWSVLGVPLVSRGTPVAALVGLGRGVSAKVPQLGSTGLRALQTLAEPAVTALDKALLLEGAQALSVTDELTHLHNARSLNQALRQETKRAARAGRPLSLLFIDLDGFKSINDTHGHLCGSRALSEAGAVIRSGARETDLVARFGGDEFALVLPDTPSSGALAVAERIRERVARHRFLSQEGLDIRLTVSIGVATLPDVADAADGLVQAADAAMYQVKGRGKNGIQVAVAADGA